MTKRQRRQALATAATALSLASILEREDRERRTEGPTNEREQHGLVVRSVKQILDARGLIANPFRGETMLERMERLGDIGLSERIAGERFQDYFQRSHLDPLQAADMMRESRSAVAHGANGIEHARDLVHGAIQALGGHSSPCGSCAWFVLGNEITIAEWARREGWGGHPLRAETAKGLLIGALGVLAKYFGT
jgi:uncharacterized protein YukE